MSVRIPTTTPPSTQKYSLHVGLWHQNKELGHLCPSNASHDFMSAKCRTNAWGVDLNYEDALGQWHEIDAETVSAILSAMGAADGARRPEENLAVVVIRAGESLRLPSPASIFLESGERRETAEDLPSDLPTGYHEILFRDRPEKIRLIVSPRRCYLPVDLKAWGWAVQLYAARSRNSWGIGDLSDLDQLARWSKEELGAGMMLLNPLSSATPVHPQQSSPYFPTSRIFLNPLWLCIEALPGADRIPDLAVLRETAHALNEKRQIDRDKVFDLKNRALRFLWSQFEGDTSFDDFCRKRGPELRKYALFCALAEQFQSGWHTWPSEYQHPGSQAVAIFEQERITEIRFHEWVQWRIDQQLASGSRHVDLMQDLPIGVDPDGADAWAWQDYIAKGVGVGAPPDEFNTQGQGWGLPPFIPHKLREVGYEPFIQTIRAAFRHGGGLRVDHVMGLFRLFWIPANKSASKGAYVRYNADEMLAIVALESERAQAYVVGEDLGTVEEIVREKLAEWGVLSYRLLWFEKTELDEFPEDALAAITTHDLPTVAGLWTGCDLERQKELGLQPNEESLQEIKTRLATLTGLDGTQAASSTEEARLQELVARAYQVLAKAPSRILTAALDDAALARDRPNIPATTSEQNPNWSIGLPVSIEDLMKSSLPHQIAAALRRQS